MFSSTISLGLALLPFVSAAIHDVVVAPEGKLQFYPEAISAQPGDQVVFHFNPKNHTVSQSSFGNPCGPKDGGFDSGFMPVPANQTDHLPTYTVTVYDSTPIWIYCRQASNTPNSHCGMGMVFAVNCGYDDQPNSFGNFKKAALAHGAELAAAATTATTAVTSSATGGYGSGYGNGDSYDNSGAQANQAAATISIDQAYQNQWYPASSTWTAAYGDYTLPPAPIAVERTDTITLGSAIWTTTYTSWPGSPNPTPASAEGNVHRVIVGGPNLVFDPPQIQASPRDTVIFEFRQKNHTVTQSSFADPCRRLSTNGILGFDSDFMPVATDASEFPTWSITINDTTPIWAYCRQRTPASHCGAGMVFAINSDEAGPRNFAAFRDVAEGINGTAAAANVDPVATDSVGAGDNAGLPVRVGATSLVVVVAAIFASLI